MTARNRMRNGQRQHERVCRRCGEPFKTHNPHAQICVKCGIELSDEHNDGRHGGR